MGEIYLLDWNGEDLQKKDDRIFRTGISLWNDVILSDFVPCDDIFVPCDDEW